MDDDQLWSFFEGYAIASLDSDPEALADWYTDDFIVAGPAGTAVFSNDEKFRIWLRQVREFN